MGSVSVNTAPPRARLLTSSCPPLAAATSAAQRDAMRVPPVVSRVPAALQGIVAQQHGAITVDRVRAGGPVAGWCFPPEGLA